MPFFECTPLFSKKESRHVLRSMSRRFFPALSPSRVFLSRDIPSYFPQLVPPSSEGNSPPSCRVRLAFLRETLFFPLPFTTIGFTDRMALAPLVSFKQLLLPVPSQPVREVESLSPTHHSFSLTITCLLSFFRGSVAYNSVLFGTGPPLFLSEPRSLLFLLISILF